MSVSHSDYSEEGGPYVTSTNHAGTTLLWPQPHPQPWTPAPYRDSIPCPQTSSNLFTYTSQNRSPQQVKAWSLEPHHTGSFSPKQVQTCSLCSLYICQQAGSWCSTEIPSCFTIKWNKSLAFGGTLSEVSHERVRSNYLPIIVE